MSSISSADRLLRSPVFEALHAQDQSLIRYAKAFLSRILALSFRVLWWNKYLAAGGIALAMAAGGYFVGHRNAPVKTVTVTEYKVQDRIVEKQVIQLQDRIVHDVQANVQTRTVTQWLPQPDGKTAVTTTTTTVDTSKTEDKTNTKVLDTSNKELDHQAVSTSKTTTTYSKPKWMLGITPFINLHTMNLSLGNTSFGASLDRRVLGNVWVGLFASSKGDAGLSLKVMF